MNLHSSLSNINIEQSLTISQILYYIRESEAESLLIIIQQTFNLSHMKMTSNNKR